MDIRGRQKKSLWRENVKQAVDIIRAHRMRSGLLILGVAIGITTILMIVTVLSGLSRKIYHDLASANRPYIYVTKFDLMVDGDEAEEQGRRRNFTREEARRLAEVCPDLDTVEFMNESAGGEKEVRFGAEKNAAATDPRLRNRPDQAVHHARRARALHHRPGSRAPRARDRAGLRPGARSVQESRPDRALRAPRWEVLPRHRNVGAAQAYRRRHGGEFRMHPAYDRGQGHGDGPGLVFNQRVGARWNDAG
jgi:hypothetical protein